jgi:hypothetical protein
MPEHPDPAVPWLRYADSGIKFIENPRWTPAERAALEQFGLLFMGIV